MSDHQNAYDRFIQGYVYGIDPASLANTGYDYPPASSSNNEPSNRSNEHQSYGDNKSGYQQRNNWSNNNSSNNYGSNDRNSNYNKNYNNNNRGSYNNDNFSSNNSDSTIQRDTIFIQNLPKNVTVDDLVSNFGSIGIIKNDKRTSQPKIWIYKDKTTGEGKGEATVTYDDYAAATAAIEWFNEKEIMGNVVKVQLATRKSNFNSNFNKGGRGGHNSGQRGGGYGSGGGGGGGGGGGRADRDYNKGGNYNNRNNDNRNDNRNDSRNNDRSRGYSNRNNNNSNNNSNSGYSRPAPY